MKEHIHSSKAGQSREFASILDEGCMTSDTRAIFVAHKERCWRTAASFFEILRSNLARDRDEYASNLDVHTIALCLLAAEDEGEAPSFLARIFTEVIGETWTSFHIELPGTPRGPGASRRDLGRFAHASYKRSDSKCQFADEYMGRSGLAVATWDFLAKQEQLDGTLLLLQTAGLRAFFELVARTELGGKDVRIPGVHDKSNDLLRSLHPRIPSDDGLAERVKHELGWALLQMARYLILSVEPGGCSTPQPVLPLHHSVRYAYRVLGLFNRLEILKLVDESQLRAVERILDEDLFRPLAEIQPRERLDLGLALLAHAAGDDVKEGLLLRKSLSQAIALRWVGYAGGPAAEAAGVANSEKSERVVKRSIRELGACATETEGVLMTEFLLRMLLVDAERVDALAESALRGANPASEAARAHKGEVVHKYTLALKHVDSYQRLAPATYPLHVRFRILFCQWKAAIDAAELAGGNDAPLRGQPDYWTTARKAWETLAKDYEEHLTELPHVLGFAECARKFLGEFPQLSSQFEKLGAPREHVVVSAG